MAYVFEGLGAGFAAFYTVYSLVATFFGIAAYVLRALGIYSIAKRRGINHPWMSWVPVLDLWVLGCVSDQYQYVVKGKVRNKRKWMLGLNITLVVVYIILFVFLGILVGSVVAGTVGGMGEQYMLEKMVGPAVAMLVCLIPLAAIAIAVMVLRYVSMYDLYTSCTPQNNVLFLVLSIFLPVTEAFFVFFIRNKEEGMPPRRQQPQYIPQQ